LVSFICVSLPGWLARPACVGNRSRVKGPAVAALTPVRRSYMSAAPVSVGPNRPTFSF